MTGLGAAGLAALSATDVFDSFSAFAERAQATTTLQKLVTAAKRERHLNVITLPRDWANYGEIMDRFQRRFSIGISDVIPLDSSAQEIQAIQLQKHQGRSPDVVDVSPAKAIEGKKAGLFLKGYTHPARYSDLARRRKVSHALASKLPAANNYKNVHFATVDQINNAQSVPAARWHSTMG